MALSFSHKRQVCCSFRVGFPLINGPISVKAGRLRKRLLALWDQKSCGLGRKNENSSGNPRRPRATMSDSVHERRRREVVAYLCLRDRCMFPEKHSIPHESVRALCSRWLIYFFTMATNEPPLLSLSLSSAPRAPMRRLRWGHPPSLSLSVCLSRFLYRTYLQDTIWR